MSEHKYKDAYKKGYEKGKQEAFTGYCMECYDELSWYEQAKLMVEWGADIPNILDKIRAEILEEKDCAYADFDKYKVDYLGVDSRYVEDELPYDDFRYGMERCIEIIDKYRKGDKV